MSDKTKRMYLIAYLSFWMRRRARAHRNALQLIRWQAAEIERLITALKDARESLEDWSLYVDEYFREKHDFDGDIARIDKALAGNQTETEGAK